VRLYSRLLVVVALTVLAPVAGLPSLACASPPDPSWIRSIYDGDDYDDVVVLITTEAGSVTVSVLPDVIQDPVAMPVPQPGRAPVFTRPASPLQSRAPPA